MFPAGSVISAYDDRADAERLRARLNTLRARFSREPALPFMVGQANLTYAKNDVANGINAEIAFLNSTRASASDGGRTVRHWCRSTTNLETFRFPESLLTVTRLNIAIAVVRQNGPGTPCYHVLLVTPSFTDNTLVARHTRQWGSRV
jgi:hypothetical protein